MTKKELIKALEPFPDNMDVFMAPRKTEFHFGLLNSVSKQDVTFFEDPFEMKEYIIDPPVAECIILDEE